MHSIAFWNGAAKKRHRMRLTAFAALFLTFAEAAAGAEIVASPSNEELREKLGLTRLFAVVDVHGPIEAGDAAALRELIEPMDLDQQISGMSGVEVVLRLHSPGGSFAEAIEIARFVKERKLQTFVARGGECLSACSVIFMAGTYEPGFRYQEVPWRKVEWPARLGFHRPFIGNLKMSIPPEVLQQLSPDEVAAAFGDEFIAAFDTANELIQRMVGVDPAAWRPELLVRMLTATEGSEEGRFVFLETVGDALTWGIDLVNAVPPGGETTVDRYVENFWLCYNSGRSIAAYTGIWPDRTTAEEGLLYDLRSCCGRQGVQWHSKMVSDDARTYYTRVRGWIYGCTIEYEELGGSPEVRFVHDDATVTRTEFMQRYNPGTRLDHAVADREETGSQVQADPVDGRCFVFRGNETVDEEPCRYQVTTHGEFSMAEAYVWPSGGRTIVTHGEDGVRINGAASSSNVGDRQGMQFCILNEDSGNTFCFAQP